MKILLVSPPTNNEHLPENPFLGLLYLAAVLRKRHDVWVINFDALKYNWKQIENRLENENPDILGITCTTLTYCNMIKICRIAKKIIPKTKIIIGGPHVTANPKESLKESRADYVVVGEGELAIQEIVENIEKKKKTKERIIYGKSVENLNRIPFPSRDLLEPSIEYYSGNLPRHESPEAVMLWSRGCPHNCLFCSNPVYKRKKPRFRSPKNILEEIKELKKTGVKEIFVYDDELIGMSGEQNKWLKEVCELIIKEKFKIIFKCQGRCSKFVDASILKLMWKAGFKTIMWGCESGSDSVLKAIRKGITTEDIKRTIKLCKRAGIEAWMFLMIGNYNETKEDVEKTIKLVKECKPDYMQVTYATPYSSDFEEICKKNNWIIERDRGKWNTNIPVISTNYMSNKDMEKNRAKIFNSYKIQKLTLAGMPKNAVEKHLRILVQIYRNFGLKTTMIRAAEFGRKFLKEAV